MRIGLNMIEKITDKCYRGFIRQEGIEGSWQLTYSDSCADAFELQLIGPEDWKVFLDFKDKTEILDWLEEIKAVVKMINTE